MESFVELKEMQMIEMKFQAMHCLTVCKPAHDVRVRHIDEKKE